MNFQGVSVDKYMWLMTRKVLIVDDSQIMREVLAKFMNNLDIEIVGKAKDGEEAIQLFKELRPDIVTLDITMPKINGIAALQQMKAMDPKAKIMIVSAITDKSLLLKALDEGAELFINKPISETAVKDAFAKLLVD